MLLLSIPTFQLFQNLQDSNHYNNALQITTHIFNKLNKILISHFHIHSNYSKVNLQNLPNHQFKF
ncbi:hypothetical protein HanRHA438_Chr13g0582851 [Helianthus annuus]|nr:hypothetical protein HanRHA438_Chr13g0582851 [Helianthus annuus]